MYLFLAVQNAPSSQHTSRKIYTSSLKSPTRRHIYVCFCAGGKGPVFVVTQPCPGRTRDISTIDISSVLGDSGLTGPLGKAPSKCKRPRCKVVTEVLDLGHVQGSWLILPCASVFEIQGLILLRHSCPEQPAVLQIQVNSLNLHSKWSGVEGKKKK